MKHFTLLFVFTIIFIPACAKLKFNEIMTSYYGFFNKNQMENNFFEFRKEGDAENEGDFRLFVIEKNHKQLGKSVILQLAKFNAKCFGGKEYCVIGKVNGTDNNEYKIDNMSFSLYNKRDDDDDENEGGSEKDGYSNDFVILLVKNEERDDDDDDWEFDRRIHNVKYFLFPKLESYLKKNAQDAVMVGNFGENDPDFVLLIRGKFNVQPIPFNMEYQKSSSYCGADNKWLTKTEPSPNAANNCVVESKQ